MTEPQERYTTATRRGVLICAGALGAGALLVGCGSNEPSSATPASRDVDDQATPSVGSTPFAAGSVNTSAVPVGGGMILADQDVVVTQPQPGVFRAFSATCTHRGCQVSSVSAGTINCPCHGAQFSIADGSAAGGPASAPLSQRAVTLNGNTLTIG
ncbi:MAG: Rieske (2Fe-2S) protein [Mycobacterium sp.]|jgi:Rieske Fe-S protein|nr:Rieske (2Fe-2S) protein [Mycobacterium sp.]